MYFVFPRPRSFLALAIKAKLVLNLLLSNQVYYQCRIRIKFQNNDQASSNLVTVLPTEVGEEED
jgi:hypothetical protein